MSMQKFIYTNHNIHTVEEHKRRKFPFFLFLFIFLSFANTLGVSTLAIDSIDFKSIARYMESNPSAPFFPFNVYLHDEERYNKAKENYKEVVFLNNPDTPAQESEQQAVLIKEEKVDDEELYLANFANSFLEFTDVNFFQDSTQLLPSPLPSVSSIVLSQEEILDKISEKAQNAHLALAGFVEQDGEKILETKIVSGDTIGAILGEWLSHAQILEAIDMAQDIHPMTQLQIGRKYHIVLGLDDTFKRFEYERTDDNIFVLEMKTPEIEVVEPVIEVAQVEQEEKQAELDPQEAAAIASIASLYDGTIADVDVSDVEVDVQEVESIPVEEPVVIATESLEENQESEQPVEPVMLTYLKPVVYDIQLAHIEASIENSLFDSIIKAGEKQSLGATLVDIFSYQIDFFRDIKKQDSFEVLVEKKYKDGVFHGYGKTLAASFTNQGVTYKAYEFTDVEGFSGYYDANGEALESLFLRVPLDFTRVSSGYNLNRKHPILGVTRPHQGIDYAAPHGTPVHAIGDGVVTFAGWQSGYGNVVILKHNNGLESQYAHLSRFDSSVKKGEKVAQGTTIAYVGSTGLSTGPHLDFRIKQNGKFVDPDTIIVPKAPPLAEKDLAVFKANVASSDEYFQGVKALTSYQPIQDNREDEQEIEKS